MKITFEIDNYKKGDQKSIEELLQEIKKELERVEILSKDNLIRIGVEIGIGNYPKIE